mgnify:CR=1 FL=1
MLRSYLTAGILKFGSTENNGYMPIPYMTSLTGPTTVVLTFKSSPYCEPNTSTGDLEVGNAVLDGREGVWVRLKEADGAKIVKADGVAVAAETPGRIRCQQQEVLRVYRPRGRDRRRDGQNADSDLYQTV